MKLNKANTIFKITLLNYFFNNTKKHFVFYSAIYPHLLIRKYYSNCATGTMACGLGAQACLGIVRHADPWDLHQPTESGCNRPSSWVNLGSFLLGRVIFWEGSCGQIDVPTLQFGKHFEMAYDSGRGALFTLWVPGPWGSQNPVWDSQAQVKVPLFNMLAWWGHPLWLASQEGGLVTRHLKL